MNRIRGKTAVREIAAAFVIGVGVLTLIAGASGCAKGSLPLPKRPGLPSAGVPVPQLPTGGTSGQGGGIPSLPSPGGGLPSAGLPSAGLPSAGLPSSPSPTGAGSDSTGDADTGDQADGADETGWEVSTELPDVGGDASEGRDGAKGADAAKGDGDGQSAQDQPTTDDALERALEDFDKGILKDRLEAERKAESAGLPEGAPQVAQNDSAGEAGNQQGEQDGRKGAVKRPPAVTPAPPTPPTPDTADARDEDVVARQILEAAEKETDPELKELLWKEYERYKAGL